MDKNAEFLGALANFGKTTTSFVMSVRLSSPTVRTERLGPRGTDFVKF